MSILETQICLWLLVTGQSQLQPQQLRIFVEAQILQSKFWAIEEARIPGNDAVRKSFQCLSSFIGFVTFTWWKMPKSHEVKNRELDTCCKKTQKHVSQ